MANLSVKAAEKYDGQSVLSLWGAKEGTAEEKDFYSFYETRKRGEELSVIEGNWKLIRCGSGLEWRSLVCGDSRAWACRSGQVGGWSSGIVAAMDIQEKESQTTNGCTRRRQRLVGSLRSTNRVSA